MLHFIKYDIIDNLFSFVSQVTKKIQKMNEESSYTKMQIEIKIYIIK